MIEVFYILIQSIQRDPISLLFTQIILSLFFIGLLPGLIFISSYISNKVPLLSKTPKDPTLFTITCVVGAVFGFYMSMVSWVFGLLCFIFFFIAISPRLKPLTALSVNPSLLTTLGILGTFVGIYMGLHEFNIANVDGSIPGLLRGLKVAFTTSIVGIVAAVILKIMQSHVPDREEKADIFDVFDNIHKVLQNHFEQSKIQHQQTLDKTQHNIDVQNQMIQFLQTRINSLESPIKQSSENFNTPFSKIKKS